MKTRVRNGNYIRVGEELDGPGVRVYINGADKTDEFLSIVGPPPEDGHGMRVPRGEHWTVCMASALTDEDGNLDSSRYNSGGRDMTTENIAVRTAVRIKNVLSREVPWK